ncbi:uncharacterized protein LOC144432911 [Glandiceps talaboti]
MRVLIFVVTLQLLTGTVLCLLGGRIPDNVKMLGVGCDKSLVKRNRIDGKWRKINGTCCVEAVGVLPDYTLVGVGADKHLYTKRAPDVGRWIGPIANSCCVRDIAIMCDGTVLGITRHDKLIYRDDLHSRWQKPSKSQGIRAVGVFRDGRILGISRNSTLKVRRGLRGEWKYHNGGGNQNVRDIAIQPDNTVLGVGKKTKGLYILDGKLKWGRLVHQSTCVISIVSTGNLN